MPAIAARLTFPPTSSLPVGSSLSVTGANCGPVPPAWPLSKEARMVSKPGTSSGFRQIRLNQHSSEWPRRPDPRVLRPVALRRFGQHRSSHSSALLLSGCRSTADPGASGPCCRQYCKNHDNHRADDGDCRPDSFNLGCENRTGLERCRGHRFTYWLQCVLANR